MLSIEEALEETSPPHAHRPEGRAWQLRGTHGGLFYRGGGGSALCQVHAHPAPLTGPEGAHGGQVHLRLSTVTTVQWGEPGVE